MIVSIWWKEVFIDYHRIDRWIDPDQLLRGWL